MYRVKPIGNKICHKKWLEHNQKMHAKRISSVKADIDNKPPPKFNHLTNRKKKTQQLEGMLYFVRDTFLYW